MSDPIGQPPDPAPIVDDPGAQPSPNQRAIEANIEQDLAAMQLILDTPNADINGNPAARIKDIARMCKRLGRSALDDYSVVE